MEIDMRSRAIVFCVAGALFASPAAAQTSAPPQASTAAQAAPAPHRVRGTIVSFDGTILTVRADTGGTVTASVLPTTTYLFNEPRKMTDLHVGDFIGSAALLGADGKLHAQEVRIFPESLRGMGEGQYSMGDNNPNRSMTNATVSEVTAISTTAGAMKLKFHGAGTADSAACTGHAAKDGNGCVGQTEISVAPGIPILAYTVGDQSALVPGAAISALVAPGPDGTWVVPRLLVEHNGIKPV
jgi:hypothetical protein